MSRILYLDPVGGISGDMCLGLLAELGADVTSLPERLAGLAVPGWSIEVRQKDHHGIHATKVDVIVEEEGHHHRDWKTIRGLIQGAGLTARAERWALEAFRRLAEAEGGVHNADPEDVHFHEVGSVDAIVDICGTAVLVDALGVERVLAGPPPLGHGQVKAAHGVLPVPAPATMRLLAGVQVGDTKTEGEQTTPTGAALLMALTGGETRRQPPMVLEATGYGAGDKSWPDRPNVLRGVLGTLEADTSADGVVCVIETNIDDMSPELVPAAIKALFAAGALDVHATPVTMKKGRLGLVLTALCRPASREDVMEALLRNTPTFGARWHLAHRTELDRSFEEVETEYGPVNVKVGRRAGEIYTAAPEYDDCAALAERRQVPVREIMAATMAAWRRAREDV